jgi:hypothetical protein
MKADPEGLSALAAGLAAAAAELSSVTAGDVVHPPLASDTVSVAAAQRLTAGAAVLMGNVGAHGSDLADLAARLSEIAAMFTAQEASNQQALRSLTRPATAAAQHSVPPLVRPPVLPDVRPPLAAVPPPGGEVFAGQVHAGSSEAGEGFGASVAAAAATLRGVAAQVRQGAEWLPQVWRSTVPGEALAKVFTSRADTFDQFAEAADGLNAQRSAHARAFTQAQQATPTPRQFAQNRQQLATAQLNNARTGGRWAAQVAQLTGERNRLEASALGAHSTYSQASTPATDPGPDAGTLNDSQTPGGGGPTPGSSGPGPTPGDQDSANLDGDPGAGLSSGGLDDPMIGQLLPAVMAAVVGGAGGLVGGLVQSLTSLPQQLLSAGSSAAQGLTQGLGAPKAKPPSMPDLSPKDSPSMPAGDGATAPSGGAGGPDLPAVSGAGPMSSPQPAPPAAAAGSVPTTATAGSPGMGGAGMGPMMPMGGAPGQSPDANKSKAEPRKVALQQLPNTERVSGEMDQRVEAVAAGTETTAPQPPPPPAEPRKSRVVRITESDTS